VGGLCSFFTYTRRPAAFPRARTDLGERAMSLRQRAIRELRAVLLTTLYFALWFGVLMLLKRLLLAQYQIEFRGLSLALFGALVVAKVVLVLDHVPLGRWTRRHPAITDVLLRTLLYTIGVFIALLLEKAFEDRHEYGSFESAGEPLSSSRHSARLGKHPLRRLGVAGVQRADGPEGICGGRQAHAVVPLTTLGTD
jgi:hypothetical protein